MNKYMSQGFPCLNPTCEYEFPHSQVKGAGELRCPECGNVFDFGGSGDSLPKATPVSPGKSERSPSKERRRTPREKPDAGEAKKRSSNREKHRKERHREEKKEKRRAELKAARLVEKKRLKNEKIRARRERKQKKQDLEQPTGMPAWLRIVIGILVLGVLIGLPVVAVYMYQPEEETKDTGSEKKTTPQK